MRKMLFLLALAPLPLFAQALAMAPKPDTSRSAAYAERVMVGAYTEFSSISDYITEYQIMKRPYTVEVDANSSYGIAGLMPLNEWISLMANAGYQKLSFDFRDNNVAEGYSLAAAELPRIDSADVAGSFNTHNVLAQIGAEIGLPLFNSYQHSLLLKLYSFGTGIGGKMYFDDTKFESGNLWGYSWGGGLRCAWSRVAVMGGVRSSHVYWRTYFDPSKKTGEQSTDDTFMLDYNANFNPYVQLMFAFN